MILVWQSSGSDLPTPREPPLPTAYCIRTIVRVEKFTLLVALSLPTRAFFRFWNRLVMNDISVCWDEYELVFAYLLSRVVFPHVIGQISI